jgi:hypothetical protein
MSVLVTFRRGFGHNLFQYALGRIVAKHLRFALTCRRQIQNQGELTRQTEEALTLPDVAASFPYAELAIDGRRVGAPTQLFELEANPSWSGQAIPLDEVMANTQPRQIRLHGYFQRAEYYVPFVKDIQEWYATTAGNPGSAPPERDVVVHLHRDPAVSLRGWLLPLSYYDRVLDGMKGLGDIYVCGTGITAAVRWHFERYQPIFVDVSRLEAFALIRRFTRIVLSNATDAWWAAFLSGAREIYGPCASKGDGYALTGYKDVNLHMRDVRYHEVESGDFERGGWTLQGQMTGGRMFVSGAHAILARDGCASLRMSAGTPLAYVAQLLCGSGEVHLNQVMRRFPNVDLVRLVETVGNLQLATLRQQIAESSSAHGR